MAAESSPPTTLSKQDTDPHVFTGIIERQGDIVDIADSGNARRLAIATGWPIGTVPNGASVAINGCCLTVVDQNEDQLVFEAGAETLSRTNLGDLEGGDQVNLERAMPANGRFDGHIVTGHIDCQGKLIRRADDAEWSEFWIEIPEAYSSQLAPKGSVALDGVSLTLVNVTAQQFSIALIPHTLNVTTLGSYGAGQLINVETDVLAKYIQRQWQQMYG